MCVCTSWSGCLQRGQRRLWSKLLSMQFLQKVWPQGVVTGSKNSLQKTKKGWERRLRRFWRVCVVYFNQRTAAAPSHWPDAERALKVWDGENCKGFLPSGIPFTWQRRRECVASRAVRTDRKGNHRQSNVHTSAAPILLPHHHLLILVSSGQEGDSLAEAEAAFASRVLSHVRALMKVRQWGPPLTAEYYSSQAVLCLPAVLVSSHWFLHHFQWDGRVPCDERAPGCCWGSWWDRALSSAQTPAVRCRTTHLGPACPLPPGSVVGIYTEDRSIHMGICLIHFV